MSAIETPQVEPEGRAPAVPAEQIWRLSVRQYRQMVRSGILTEDDPVELLEGWLVPKMPKNPPHRLATRRVRTALEGLLPSGWFVETQEPITTADSEPEPDVTLVRGTPEDYADRHPGPEDLALVVEIADATLQRDRTIKRRLYAAAGIPTYWILNLPEQVLEVHSAPDRESGDYRSTATFATGDRVTLRVGELEVGPFSIDQFLA